MIRSRPRGLGIRAMAGAHRGAARAKSILASARRPRAGATRASSPLELNNENVLAAAAKMGVDARTLPGGFLELEKDGQKSRSRSSDFEFERLIPWFLCGDKSLTSMVLAEAGIPVASNVCCTARELDRALAFLRATGGPVVTKPARGTASGAGITLDIADGRALRRGFARARAYSSGILVEEQVEGQNVRITVLAGEVLGVVLRTPALVVGDGRHSVVELIRSKNGRLEAGEPGNRMLWPIRVDGELRRVLRMQSLTLDSVPQDGQDVPLRLVANSGQGGEIDDARSRVHDEYLRMAVAAADAVGATLCGVDLIIPDLESPPTGNGTVINEVNTTPSLYIVNGLVDGVPSTYAAERVLEHLFDTR